jgi:ABC-type lipoprotein export system ATPase subunit/GNAT superfamily N-acetyltransferase
LGGFKNGQKQNETEGTSEKASETSDDGRDQMTRERREYFRIKKFARRYDKQTSKFLFDIAYETATVLTPRTVDVAEAFGLGIDVQHEFLIYDNVELRISPVDVVYVTGDSGSGKSVLLGAIKKDLGEEATDMASIQPDPDEPIIDTVGENLSEALELLSKAGLNDAFLFVRRFGELSDGQKYRYKIAELVERGGQWWIADEFCSVLDRDTAKIVAFNLQKVARQMGKAVIVATTHTDLSEDLAPTVHVHKRFGKEISINYYENHPAIECSLVKEMQIADGTFADYKALSVFHYRSSRCPPPRKIFTLRRGEELCGVIVFSYPPPIAFGRSQVWKGSFCRLQQEVSTISRVVVHPKYRTIGLGAKLVRETLRLAGTPYVEMMAVMAKYNPFAEKAGMQRIAEQKPSEEAERISEVLARLGFGLQFLGSNRYVKEKLEDLTVKQLAALKLAFIENAHPRLLKEFEACQNRAYGNKADYVKGVKSADLAKMARLIKVLSVLLQSKVYLFKNLGGS